MGVHKTVNGAYRYRYAPFLMSTYYVMGRSPLALPLGELSPQVTERVLPFALSVLAALGHLSHRERQGIPTPYTERCIEVHDLFVHLLQ